MAHLQGKVDGPGQKGTWRQSSADRLFPTWLPGYGMATVYSLENGMVSAANGDRPPFGPSHLGEQNGDRQMRYEIRDSHQTSDSEMPPGVRRYHGTGTCVIHRTMGTPWGPIWGRNWAELREGAIADSFIVEVITKITKITIITTDMGSAPDHGKSAAWGF
ncbi:uncharacterized protein N7498_000133 [Penicillium cinerascens]|uniref:Uncharacterized protein n=1 Tax=Penicillium cinerascens TaxID=70096 RepID=A0A9W9NFX5_9EURO|nr:uncharacterized protein N7498_000133 [Penicillium cinerascens]KAJ5218034.1 hypothetical protein N7498_000133 [Penicillium cinerascens]